RTPAITTVAASSIVISGGLLLLANTPSLQDARVFMTRRYAGQLKLCPNTQRLSSILVASRFFPKAYWLPDFWLGSSKPLDSTFGRPTCPVLIQGPHDRYSPSILPLFCYCRGDFLDSVDRRTNFAGY